MNIFLDTSVIISFLVSDKHTNKAEGIFSNIFEAKIKASIASLVLVEVCGVLSRYLDKEKALAGFSQVNEWLDKEIIEFIDINKSDANVACAIALDYKIKGSDALIAAIAHNNKSKLATFDNELANRLKNKIEIYEFSDE